MDKKREREFWPSLTHARTSDVVICGVQSTRIQLAWKCSRETTNSFWLLRTQIALTTSRRSSSTLSAILCYQLWWARERWVKILKKGRKEGTKEGRKEASREGRGERARESEGERENGKVRWWSKMPIALTGCEVAHTTAPKIQVDYLRVAPPNSFIHVDDFSSPRQLANYLHLIDRNLNLYAKYFRCETGASYKLCTWYQCQSMSKDILPWQKVRQIEDHFPSLFTVIHPASDGKAEGRWFERNSGVASVPCFTRNLSLECGFATSPPGGSRRRSASRPDGKRNLGLENAIERWQTPIKDGRRP